MAKITIGRIFEASKILATKSGTEIKDMVTYVTDFAEQTIRALRNGLTFEENFKCTIKTVKLTNNTAQVVLIPPAKSKVTGVIPLRVNGGDGFTSFFWDFNEKSEVFVKINFVTTTNPVDVTLIFLF